MPHDTRSEELTVQVACLLFNDGNCDLMIFLIEVKFTQHTINHVKV